MAPVHPVYDCIRRTHAKSRSGPLVPPNEREHHINVAVYASPTAVPPAFAAPPYNTGHENLHTP